VGDEEPGVQVVAQAEEDDAPAVGVCNDNDKHDEWRVCDVVV
jgi:hypothetical protein